MRPFAALLVAALLAIPAAATTTVTFDAFAPPQTPLEPSFDSEGLTFTANGLLAGFAAMEVWPGGLIAVPPIADNGTQALIFTTADLAVSRTGGGAFRLVSADVGLSFNSLAAEDIAYVLHLRNGGQQTGILSLTNGFATFTFDKDVTSAVFGAASGYVALDNIVIGPASVIPEPASWALLLAGFAAVGLAGRRQRDWSPRQAN